MPLRNTASPPIEIASSDAPWKESHSDSVLWRPVATRASFSAMPIASVPPGANSTLPSGSGARSASLRASADRGSVRVAPRRERQRVELRVHGGHHVRMPIADLMDAVAVEVHDPPALDVGEPDAVARRERVEARRRQRLVQEHLGVGVEQRARRRVDVRRLERAAQRREVDVALGGNVDGGRRSGPDLDAWPRHSLPRQRVRLDVGEALHRFLHAFLVAEPGILDAAEGRELEPIARALRGR